MVTLLMISIVIIVALDLIDIEGITSVIVDLLVNWSLMLMLVIVNFDLKGKRKQLFRTVKRNNIRRVAKSIHKYFPESKYSYLEAKIFNAFEEGLKELILP